MLRDKEIINVINEIKNITIYVLILNILIIICLIICLIEYI